MEKIVTVGCVGKPYGIRGWAKITSYTQPADNILSYPSWFIQKQGSWEPLDMSTLSIHADNGGHIRIKFPGCDNPETARLYGNLLIGVTRDQLPALSVGEHYWSELEGLTVTNNEGILLGKVSHLFSTGANDVMVVKGDRERLLPYIKDVIVAVDLEKGQMIVDWDADF